MLDLTTLAWYNEVRLGVWGSTGHANHLISCHKKNFFYLRFRVAIVSVF